MLSSKQTEKGEIMKTKTQTKPKRTKRTMQYPPVGPVSTYARFAMRWLVDTLYGIQKLGTQNTNRGSALTRGMDHASEKLTQNISVFGADVEDMERGILKQLRPLIEAHPLGARMRGIKGLGSESLAGKFLGLIDKEQLHPACDAHVKGRDPTCEACHRPTGLIGAACFETPSKLIKFAKLAVDADGRAQHDVEGQPSTGNARLKSLLVQLLAEQFVRLGGPYKDAFYQQGKARYTARRHTCPEHGEKESYKCHRCWTPMHVERAARRRMMKVFLQHAWEIWRRAEGLSIRRPYVIEQLGHETVYAPEDFGWDVTGLAPV
jgi:hypothetical protein